MHKNGPKVAVKALYNVTKDYFFYSLCIGESWKKIYHSFQQNIKRHNLFLHW